MPGSPVTKTTRPSPRAAASRASASTAQCPIALEQLHGKKNKARRARSGQAAWFMPGYEGGRKLDCCGR